MGRIFDVAYCPDATDRRSRLASPAGDHDTAPLDGIAPALIIDLRQNILRGRGHPLRRASRTGRVAARAMSLPEVGHGFNLIGATRLGAARLTEGIAEEVGQQLKTGP